MTPLYRRNFLPTVIANLVLWIICGLIVFFLDPDKNFQLPITNYQLLVSPNIILFFLALTLSLTLTLALLFSNTRRGFFTSLLITGVLILRLLKFVYWWNILILAIVFLTAEILCAHRQKQDNKITG